MSDTSNAAKRHLELVHSQIDVGALTKTVPNFNGGKNPGNVVIPSLPKTFGRGLAPFAKYRALLPDRVKALSRQHARLTRSDQDGTLYIEDLGSTNGTWLNGVKIERHTPVALSDGDRLTFGDGFFSFIVKFPDSEPVPAKAENSSTPPVMVDLNPSKSRTVYFGAAISFFSIFQAGCFRRKAG